jgi:hypothetical protein
MNRESESKEKKLWRSRETAIKMSVVIRGNFRAAYDTAVPVVKKFSIDGISFRGAGRISTT